MCPVTPARRAPLSPAGSRQFSARATRVLISITLKIQSTGYLERVMATTTAYPHLFEISITLTFTAGYLKRVINTAIDYSRSFEFLTTLTFRALHGHKHVPDPSNNSLYLINLFSSTLLREAAEGISSEMVRVCLSPPKPKYKERFARPSTMFFEIFCYISNAYLYIKYMCYHESSRTPQHSRWNCVCANRPQHMHMEGHILCD